MFDPRYKAYITSNRWKLKREQYFAVFGKMCRICRIRSGPIHLHHMDYSRLGSEALTDLVALCESHHKMLTSEWRARGKRSGMSLRQFTNYFIARERGKRKI